MDLKVLYLSLRYGSSRSENSHHMDNFFAAHFIGSVGGTCIGGKRSVARLPLVGLIRSLF